MRAILDMVAVIFLQTGGSQEFPLQMAMGNTFIFLLWPHTVDWAGLARPYLCL